MSVRLSRHASRTASIHEPHRPTVCDAIGFLVNCNFNVHLQYFVQIIEKIETYQCYTFHLVVVSDE